MTRTNKQVCFIAGAGHSGSTLLGLILGSHSHGFYAGEATKTRYLGNPKSPERKRVCKICGADCPVWGDIELKDNIDIYEQISQKTGRSLIIDSGKGIDWLEEQLARLAETTATPHFIFLKRDGRAVINSRIRKYPDKEPKQQIRAWMKQIEATQEIYDHFSGKKMILHYESLATTPKETTQELCDFLGIPYEADMIRYYEHTHHPLGGNTGTQFIVAKAQQIEDPFLQLSDRNEYYYHEHPLAIRLDLRWQEELSSDILTLFEQEAGTLNRSFAYPFDA